MQHLKNFGLLLIAVLLSIPCFPVGILVTVAVALDRGSIKKIAGYLSNSALSIALSIDTMGNVVCRDLLNYIMRKEGGYEFGFYQDTISRVLGKNKASNTLTRPGRALANLLNRIDKDHVERAAK